MYSWFLFSSYTSSTFLKFSANNIYYLIYSENNQCQSGVARKRVLFPSLSCKIPIFGLLHILYHHLSSACSKLPNKTPQLLFLLPLPGHSSCLQVNPSDPGTSVYLGSDLSHHSQESLQQMDT